MKLHCLGTTGYHPSETRHTSCYFIPEAGLVLDAGSGIFRLPELIETDHLDILLSHAHLDHVFGLTFLLDILFQRPVASVRVWGESQKLDAIKEHLFSEFLFPVLPDVQWRPLPSEPFDLEGGARVTTFPLEHPGGTVGFHLQFADVAMAYVTDTTADTEAAYVKQIHGVNHLLHECNFRTSQAEWAVKTGHSYCERVGEVAAKAKVGRTWLCHLNPLEKGDDPVGIDDAKKHFPHTQVVADQMVIDLAKR